ncbi:MAG: molybdopterin-guanine dinucleotide biosynthesis protein B [Myxococcaceae bacterium]|nr:molybdopterin-guanine dinucleotide biosynthesis protein B [Myxococcaceae bacterium]
MTATASTLDAARGVWQITRGFSAVQTARRGRQMRVFGVVGFSGSGKTTLLERIIPSLVAAGQRVSLVKHAHHRVDIDRPGKDSFRLRAAGCAEVLLASGERWALMHELRGAPEPTLFELVSRLSPCDLVLIEGFKSMPVPRLEVHRPSLGHRLMCATDPGITAVASDEAVTARVPVLRLDDLDAICRLVLDAAIRAPLP